MLTMSRSCNAASEQGSSSGWKESYRSTAESVESFEDSVDSDNSSSSSHASRSQSGSSLQPPIGCITTHNVSAVIRPEKKMPPIDPLQFVKIQKNELSKKAVEQIKLAEEVKITKEKIKEVEEEWQNNLMSWKSKRKLTKNNSEDESVLSRNTNRKTKTFSEILNEKAKAGARIGYNLHRYADVDFADELAANFDRKDYAQRYEAAQRIYDSSQLDEDTMTFDQFASSSNSELSFDPTESNLNRLLKSNSLEPYSAKLACGEICRNGLGDVVVFNTTLLEEFSIKSDGCDAMQMNGHEADANRSDGDTLLPTVANTQLQQQPLFNLVPVEEPEQIYHNQFETSPQLSQESNHEFSSSVPSKTVSATSQKVHVPINDWKSSQCKSPKQSVPSSDDDAAHHNSSFEVEDEEDELDEELERLRLDQERSFKAKLYAFENLAKQEEEAARKAAESYRRRQQSRQAKLAAERSKSLGNIQQSSSSSHHKAPVSTSHSILSSSIPVSQATFSPEPVGPSQAKSQQEKQSKSLQNLNSPEEYSLSNTTVNSANSTIYNFTEKAPRSQDLELLTVQIEQKSTASAVQPHKSSQPKPTEVKSHPSQAVSTSQQAQNIYENITPLGLSHQHQPTQSQPCSPIDPASDSNAIRNASQKLLQQQQQIYQNQPLPTQYQQQQHYPQEHYSSVPPSAANFGFQFEPSANLPSHHLQPVSTDHPIQPTDTILNDKVINPVPIRGYSISDDVGLPPIQITKSNQSGPNKAFNPIPPLMPLATANQEEEHLYVNQNQLLLNPAGKSHNPVYPYDYRPNSATYENYNPGLHYPEPNYENKTLIQKRMEDSSNGNAIYPYAGTQNQYLYYPKPYSAASASVKPIVKQQPPLQMMPSNVPRAVPLSQNNAARYAPNGFGGQQPRVAYNQNHWLLQEAELRRQLDSMESSSTWLKNPSGMQQPQQHSKNGQPSVSGKKKCSSCMDELGKGCAAMVVESLSLFYHINCFRCSVCNVQLGNGTVGTDVRVRNNKLHCQNCYSNDEAGLKFSRV